MKWANGLRRWTLHSIHSAILGASLVGPASLAIGQTPTAQAVNLPPPVYSRHHAFELPMNMSDAWRAKVSEFRLYSKTPTTAWKLQDSGKQTLQKFDCKVPADGEYWYTLMTVDLQGKSTPGDVNAEPAGQRVIVDTTAPVLVVQGATHEDGVCLRCTMQDANPDLSTLRAVYKTETGEVALDSVPNQPGLYKLKGPEWMRFPVVFAGTDKAKNVATKEVNVQELLKAMLAAGTKREPTAPDAVASPMSVAPAPRVDGTSPRVEGPPLVPKSNVPAKVEPATKPDVPAKIEPATKLDLSAKVEPATKLDMPERPLPFGPEMPHRVETPVPPPLNLAGHAATGAEPNINVPGAPAVSPAPLPAVPESTPRGSIPYQLISTTHASVDYRIDQVGPSGVGKVEIYMTPDKGQTWHRLGEDSDKRSPAEINLPGDGVFGIRIVLTNGNGFGGRAPARGETAHCEIEVDSTNPFVQLRSADVLPASGQVEIRWNANDRNFGNAPISIYYRTRIDNPWQVVARGLKNDGMYRWGFPRDSSGQFFFKIEASDQAGNLSNDVTRQPIVIDMSEPRATVVGVTGSGATPARALPNGN